jgi:putative phosphoesterase
MIAMKIGIVSDTHGRQLNTRLALDELKTRGIHVVLHCGDIDDPDSIGLFAGFEVHFVFGNCDWDRTPLRHKMTQVGATLHENFGHVELEGVRIAFTHGDDKGLLYDLEKSGAYDFLFYGHTHIAEEHTTGPTRVINPGALHRARPKTFVVVDLETRVVERIEIPG